MTRERDPRSMLLRMTGQTIGLQTPSQRSQPEWMPLSLTPLFSGMATKSTGCVSSRAGWAPHTRRFAQHPPHTARGTATVPTTQA